MSRRPLGDALLLVAAVAAFRGVLSPDLVFYQRDLASYWYPQVATLQRVLAGGSLPFWDPFEGLGTPLADPSAQLFYPPTALLLLLSPALYLKLFVVGHVWGSGLGVRRLARRHGVSEPAALGAALAWQWAGPFLSMASVWHHFASAAWMPWVLLGVEHVLERAAPRRVALLAAAIALQLLAGSADLVFMTALLALARLLAEPRGRWVPAALPLAAAGALAAALAAVQWIPTALQLAGTSRARMAGLNLFWSLHPWSLVDLVAPRLVTDLPMVQPVRQLLFEGREPFLGTLYLGPVVLALAIVGAIVDRGRRWAAVGAVVLLLLALGAHGPLAAILVVPPFSVFRYPVKYLAPAGLAVVLLAGSGAAAWQRPLEARGRRAFVAAALVLLAIAAALTGAASWASAQPARVLPLLEGPLPAGAAPERALLGPVLTRLVVAALAAGVGALLCAARARHVEPGRVGTWALAALFAVAGLSAARRANELAPAEVIAPQPLPPSLQQADRVLSLPVSLLAENRSVRTHPGWSREATFIRRAVDCLAPVSAARFGLRGSFDGDPTFLGPPLLSEASGVVAQYLTSYAGLRLLQAAGVARLVACDDRELGAPYEMLDERRGTSGARVRVFGVPGAVPRIHAVGEVIGARDVEAAWRGVTSRDFDPGRQVVVRGAAGRRAPAPALHVEIDRADRVRATVVSEGPSMLVVATANLRGWSARVDGAAAAIADANLLFQAVDVPAGRHEVELRFTPPGLGAGAAASAVALVVAALLLARRELAGDSAAAVASAAR